LRVVVYGDSFVLATLTELEETFPKQLETKLSSALHRPVEAINAGVVGYGPDQVSLRFEDEITTLHPDLAVVAIYAGNDFGDLMRNKIYRLGPNGELIQNHYRLSSRQIADFPDKPWEVPWSMLVRGVQHLVKPADPPGHEAPWRRGRERPEDQLKRYLNKSRLEYKFRGTATKAEVDNLFGDTYNADVAFTPDASSSEYAVRVMEGVMVRIGSLAAARGLPVLFLIIPAGLDVCPGSEAAWVEVAAAYPAYRPDGLTSLLSEIARRNHLEYVDLFRPFDAACSRALYFKRDGHWNSEGQALAADLVASHVVAQKMVR
jgi:hypothetical protein